MERTELAKMDKEKRKEKIKKMETSRLFAELDDTIQMDIMNISNEEWLNYADKKVYLAIVRELKERLYKYEHKQTD